MKRKKTHQVWVFFAAVYLVSALLYTPIIISGRGMSTTLNTILMVCVTFVPSILGILFVYKTKSTAEIKNFWKRTLRWPKGYTKNALIALAILPVLFVSTYSISSWISTGKIVLTYGKELLSNWSLILQFFAVEFFLGAVSEELGWRGYALDELQSRWGAIPSSLVLGFIWAIWHTPAYLIPGLSQYEMGGVFSWPYISFICSVTISSILHTWGYNYTGRSILVGGVLMHFFGNAALIFLGGIFDQFHMPEGYWIVLPLICSLMVLLTIRIYRKRSGAITKRKASDSNFSIVR